MTTSTPILCATFLLTLLIGQSRGQYPEDYGYGGAYVSSQVSRIVKKDDPIYVTGPLGDYRPRAIYSPQGLPMYEKRKPTLGTFSYGKRAPGPMRSFSFGKRAIPTGSFSMGKRRGPIRSFSFGK